MDFTVARDDGVAVASAGPYANHLHLAAEITMTIPLKLKFFRPAGCGQPLPATQPKASIKGISSHNKIKHNTIKCLTSNTVNSQAAKDQRFHG